MNKAELSDRSLNVTVTAEINMFADFTYLHNAEQLPVVYQEMICVNYILVKLHNGKSSCIRF